MSDSAEAMAASQQSRRNVTIEITNLTNRFCLLDPRIYLESGHCHSPPEPTVRPLQTEVCNFTKTSGKASGAVGVMTYDLFQQHRGAQDALVIMFSVPHDNNTYKNWLSLGIVPKETACDQGLYKRLYYDSLEEGGPFVRAESTGSCLMFRGPELDLLATMSPLGRCILKVELWEKVFSAPMGQRH